MKEINGVKYYRISEVCKMVGRSQTLSLECGTEPQIMQRNRISISHFTYLNFEMI